MNESSGGLSDALRALANGPPEPPDSAQPADGGADAAVEGELTAEVEGEIDDEAGDIIAAAPTAGRSAGGIPGGIPGDPGRAAPTMTTAQRQAAIRAAQANRHRSPAKIALMGGLFVMGLAMLWLGIWSVGILCGLWTSAHQDAKTVALFMLMGWPLAAVLLGGAAILLRLYRRAKLQP
jgi:hypothetical protein